MKMLLVASRIRIHRQVLRWGGVRLRIGRNYWGVSQSVANTLVVLVAAAWLMVWLIKYTLPSLYWLAAVIVLAVTVVVLVQNAVIATTSMTVTLKKGKLDVEERRPLGGDRRLSCASADVLDVDMTVEPRELTVALRDGRRIGFLEGRCGDDLYLTMVAMRDLLGLPARRAMRVNAVTSYARRLGPQTPGVEYSSTVPQLFRDGAGTGVLIVLPAKRGNSSVRITPDGMEVVEDDRRTALELDHIADVNLRQDEGDAWLEIVDVSGREDQFFKGRGRRWLEETRRLIRKVLRMDEGAESEQ